MKRLAGSLLTLTLALFAAACHLCGEAKWGYTDGCFGAFPLAGPTKTTPSGVAYDPSGLSINPALIDRLVHEAEVCMPAPIVRNGFAVKIAANYTLGCESNPMGQQELLPVSAPDASCAAKGLPPDPDCPCEWRAGVECPNIIVTTPSFYLFKDALLRFETGTINTWGTPALLPCVQPTTGPLSDGSGP